MVAAARCHQAAKQAQNHNSKARKEPQHATASLLVDPQWQLLPVWDFWTVQVPVWCPSDPLTKRASESTRQLGAGKKVRDQSARAQLRPQQSKQPLGFWACSDWAAQHTHAVLLFDRHTPIPGHTFALPDYSHHHPNLSNHQRSRVCLTALLSSNEPAIAHRSFSPCKCPPSPEPRASSRVRVAWPMIALFVDFFGRGKGIFANQSCFQNPSSPGVS